MKNTSPSSSSSSSSSSATRQRRQAGRSSHRFAAAFATSSLAALKLLDRVQCLLIMPPHHHSTRIPSTTNNFNGRRTLASFQTPLTHGYASSSSSSPSSSTALHLWGGFEKFLQPYGVSNHTSSNNNDGGNDDELNQSSSVELLDALLPRLQTKEEKSRILEGFQRARLDEQLRLSKLSKSSSGEDNDIDDGENAQYLVNDEGDEVTGLMTDSFQRARLAEQLRLSKRSDGGDDDDGDHLQDRVLEITDRTEHEQAEHQNQRPSNNTDNKDEAFQRALLGERLKIRRRVQQRRQSFVNSSDSIEKAMMEYETEKEEEKKKSFHTLITMVEEKEENDLDVGEGGEAGQGAKDEIVVSSTPLAGENNNKAVTLGGGQHPLVNQTDDNEPSKQLLKKLEGLRQTVEIATTSPSSITRSLAVSLAKPTGILQFPSLPLPPREDASPLSITLAPVAHFLSSVFLLGAAAFYAVIAVMDVLWNDGDTKTCLKDASSVWKSCGGYAFPKAGVSRDWSTVRRIAKALQTSVIVSFLVTKCILMRAAKHSKYAIECMDAGTGALRYLVYAMRSIKVVWKRTVDSLIVSFRKNKQSREISSLASTEKKSNKLQTLRHRLNPLRALSDIKSTAAQESDQQRSLEEERKRLHSNDVYTNKMRLLNLDRVALERDRQDLFEAQRQLEIERGQLRIEGVNLLAWYSAAREAATATEEAENSAGGKQQRKRRWSFWRGRTDKQ
mmetsp:Transcript_37567/g.78690  ORF Transcript_37567/g.78690 Transcript_37567/m.78690 type:complete len:728 (+) Transcript_37567:81-2264(+)